MTEELSYKYVGAWLANEPQQLYDQFTAHKDGSQGESTADATRGAGEMECT